MEVENSLLRDQVEVGAKEFKNMEKENMVRNIKEVQEIQDQVKREKEGRRRAEKEVEILREQTSILA